MPVFAISIDDVQARAATMAAGADLFLPKPVVLRDLFTTLDHLMLNRDAVPPRA
jgi:DNA-binding response OmpR family regulator